MPVPGLPMTEGVQERPGSRWACFPRPRVARERIDAPASGWRIADAVLGVSILGAVALREPRW